MNDWLHNDEVPPSIGVDLSVTPKIHYPPQGMTSDVAIVNSGNRDIVVKRCSSSIYLPWLRREYEVLSCLDSTDLPVPRPIGYVERNRPSGPEAWLTMTKVNGHALNLQIEDLDQDERLATGGALNPQRLHHAHRYSRHAA